MIHTVCFTLFFGVQYDTELLERQPDAARLSTNFVKIFFVQNITVSIFTFWGVWVEGGLFAFNSYGNTWSGEKSQKTADCLPAQLRVGSSSASVCDSMWVTVKNKVWHVYKSNWQFQKFIFSIVRVDTPLKGLPCKAILLVPLWSQAESSLLVGTWVEMTIFADKPTRHFWQKPGYWSITVLWISLQSCSNLCSCVVTLCTELRKCLLFTAIEALILVSAVNLTAAKNRSYRDITLHSKQKEWVTWDNDLSVLQSTWAVTECFKNTCIEVEVFSFSRPRHDTGRRDCPSPGGYCPTSEPQLPGAFPNLVLHFTIS